MHNTEQAISNTVATITELDDRIIRERDEKRINELRAPRDLLIKALTALTVDHEDNINQNNPQY